MSSKKAAKTAKAAKKTAVKAVTLTPKQASVTSVNLLRGLDNAIKASQRNTSTLEVLKSRVGTLSSGLSNLAAKPAIKAAPAKPASKAAAPANPAKPVKVKPAKPAKAVKPVKPAPAKPAAKQAPAEKPAPAKASSAPAKQEKPPVPGRPSVRVASKEVLAANGWKMPSADLREAVKAKYGYYSNQTFYDLFKKDPELSLTDNVVSYTPAVKSDKDLELVRRVEQDRTTASVV